MRNAGVFRAMATWVAVALHAQAWQRRVTGALAELRGQGLRRGWHKWQAVHRCGCVIRRGVMVIMNYHQFRAIRKWLELWERREQGRRRAISAIEQWSGHGHRRAWLTWREQGAMRTRMRLYVAALTMRRERSALRGWAEGAQSRERCTHALRWAASALCNRRLRIAFNLWTGTEDAETRLHVLSLIHI